MKLISKIALTILVMSLCGALALFFIKAANRQAIRRMPVAEHPVAKESVAVSTPFSPQTNTILTSEPKLPITGSNVITSTTEKKAFPESAIPTKIDYRPTAYTTSNENLVSILVAVSNAVSSVDHILKAQNYKVHEFGRTKWLIAEDKDQSTVWTIFPYKTNTVVGSVEAVVYQDKALTQKDQTRSFRMSFYPETGTLRNFSWGDKHEVLFIQTNGAFDYGRDISEKMGLVMRWGEKGKLIFSNAYDRTKLGKPIGLPQQTDKTPYRFGPTSSVEAATESWRQKQK